MDLIGIRCHESIQRTFKGAGAGYLFKPLCMYLKKKRYRNVPILFSAKPDPFH